MDNSEQQPVSVPFHAGYVAIIGEPNVGKSTLMNSFVGQKISIVTNKPQTTRHKVVGVCTTDSYQVVFMDTPGLLLPKYMLHESMMKMARSAIQDADLILFMIECASSPGEAECETAFQVIRSTGKPVYLIINKVDLFPKSEVASAIAVQSARFSFKEVFPISALQHTGTAELLKHVAAELPEHPPFFPADVVSEQSERFFVAEIIREKIFERYREEIPYSTTVDIIDFKERKGRKDVIEAEICVERSSQKGILIGNGGAALKEIGETARKDIEAFLERPVFLSLHVRVREKWREKSEWLKRLGYA